MTTTLIPPTPGPAPDPQSPPPAASGSSRVVAIIVIVFGTLVILGTLASAIFTTVAAASVHSTTRTVAVAGVSSLDVDVDAGSLRVEFADVSEAELDVTSSWGADRWTLEHDGDRLVVATPERFGPWFVGDWFPGRIGEAVLRLPSSLAGADADFALAAGDLTVDGEFGDLRVEVGAGGADVSGSADTFEADISAGSADFELADVSTASLTVSAGGLDARLSGSQPDEITVDVSAGSLNLTVPDGEYNVTSEVSAGGFENKIGSSPDADSTVDVQVSAGQVVLRAR